MIGTQFRSLLISAPILLGLIACLSFSAQAEFPELPPAYTDTVALRDDASLQAVDFANRSLGVAVGDRGVILRTENGGITWQDALAQNSHSDVQCRLDDVRWVNSQRVVAVGGHYDRITGISRGVVLTSRDAGRTWQRGADEDLPRLQKLSVRKQDNALIATGDWQASALGRVFESHDGGRTWKSGAELDGPAVLPATPTASDFAKWTAATKVNAPIRDACRVGESALCAVCDHGIILVSQDGGKTWQTTRGEQRRSAVLVIANQPRSVAWPLIGNEALEMRHRVSVLIANSKRSLDPSSASEIDLARQAAVALGAASVDTLSHDTQKPSTLKTSGDPSAKISQDVSQWIAIHRPSVIVVDKSLPQSIRKLVSQAAVHQRIRRVVTYSFDSRGESMLHNGAMLPNAGVLARDMWQDAMQLVAPNLPIQQSVSLRRVYDSSDNSQRGESVATGIQLRAGQKLTAKVQPASRRQLQIIQARLSLPRRVDDLILGSPDASEFRVALGSLLDQTAAPDRFRLAWSVLLQTDSQRIPRKAMRAGLQATVLNEAVLNEAVLNEIADRFGDTSAGNWAKLRVDSMANSNEWSKLNQSISELVQTKDVDRPVAEIVPVSPFQTDSSRVVQASAIAPLQVARPRQVARRRTQKETSIDLGWEFHPLVLIAREAARNRGDDNELQETTEGSGNLRRLRRDPYSRAWANLLNTSGASVVIARATDTPPRLDGQPNDACWQGALRAAGRTPVQIAYDEDYVYIALTCSSKQLRHDDTVPTKTTPIRDHDLSNTDRMLLSIDTDQDLLTSLQFAVTDAGRTRDAIDRHDAWNPTWYIATERTDTSVHFELAIQRRDISELPIVPGQSWFVSTRVVTAGDRPTTVLPKVEDWLRVVFK